jgi:deoxyribodipyrimidine photo-lyase
MTTHVSLVRVRHDLRVADTPALDAVPYFCIFNPVMQGETFGSQGDYVRRWVPELERLPAAWVHKSWEAPANVLTAAGIKLGVTCSEPMVDPRTSRARALAALAE